MVNQVKTYKLFILLSIVFISNLYANNKGYINIDSNTKAQIFIDGEFIANTPKSNIEVDTNKDIILQLRADNNYHPNTLTKTINVKKDVVPTYSFHFTKGLAEIFLVGENGSLFINDKYQRDLSKNNRIIQIPAGKNTKIEISTKNKKSVFYKNLEATKFYKIKYDMIIINKSLNLSTFKTEKLLWQDDGDSKSKLVKFEDAQKYCKELELAGFTNWRLPTIKELEELNKYKKQIEEGLGNKAYWSSTIDEEKSKIWKYAITFDFEKEKALNKVAEFFDGNIRCVRDD